jgi:hypothetical protein
MEIGKSIFWITFKGEFVRSFRVQLPPTNRWKRTNLADAFLRTNIEEIFNKFHSRRKNDEWIVGELCCCCPANTNKNS